MPSINQQTYLLLQYLINQELAQCGQTSSQIQGRSLTVLSDNNLLNTVTTFYLIKNKINSICSNNC
jgi:hypothetical protein|tara:strand:+ start:4627 stop:4824 length:198 start_codon:yes stop_codon:yes gene_type:complete